MHECVFMFLFVYIISAYVRVISTHVYNTGLKDYVQVFIIGAFYMCMYIHVRVCVINLCVNRSLFFNRIMCSNSLFHRAKETLIITILGIVNQKMVCLLLDTNSTRHTFSLKGE